jgi:hypothetical protein
MKIQNPIGKQTLMKSNAQLRRDDFDDVPAAMPVGPPLRPSRLLSRKSIILR